MSRDVVALYLKECLLEAKQTLACVNNSPKKPIIGNKTKPLGSQSVKPKNEKLGLPIMIHKVWNLKVKNLG